MRLRFWLMVASLLFSTAVSCNDRGEKVRKLIEVQGVLETFQTQMEAGKEACRAQARQAISQVTATLNAPLEFQARFSAATENYIKAAEAPWGAEHIVERWTEHYGKHFSDTELDQLIAFYSSDLGQREVVVSRDAMSALSTELQAAYMPVLQSATSGFMQELQKITEECNCRK